MHLFQYSCSDIIARLPHYPGTSLSRVLPWPTIPVPPYPVSYFAPIAPLPRYPWFCSTPHCPATPLPPLSLYPMLYPAPLPRYPFTPKDSRCESL